MKLDADITPKQKYFVDFSNVYGVDRMILYDDHSSVVGVAMFKLEDVEKAISEYRAKGMRK